MLALLLTWTLVTASCTGGPETIASYEVRGQHVRLVGWTQDEIPQPIYTDRAPLQASVSGNVDNYPISGAPLLPGDVAWWELTAVDAADNRSDQCGP